MEDRINDNTNNIFRKRRPVPIPIYDDRYMERPYLKKNEIARIRDNLDELVEIKSELVNKPTENKPKIDMPEPKNVDKKHDIKDDFFLNSTTDTHIPTTTNVSTPEIKSEVVIVPASTIHLPIIDSKVKSEPKVETKIETKPEVKPEVVSEIKKDETKFGISNLENKQPTQITQQTDDNKPKNKIIKKKVIKRMNDEEVVQYNISPEERRRRLKTDIQEVHEENATKEAIRKSAELAEQNKRELEQTRREIEEFKKTLTSENAQVRSDLKQEFGTKFNELGGTSIPYEFQESWLKWYRKLSKNPATGTRVGREHPAYRQYQRDDQTQKVREFMKLHPELVEKVRKEHGLL